MGRPRKDSADGDAKLRIYRAYWKLLETTPINRITAGSITKEARCNRGTFYYHFDSVDALTDRAIERSILSNGMLVSALAIWSADRQLQVTDAQWEENLRRVTLLINRGCFERVGRVAKASILRIRQAALSPDGAPLPDDTALMLEFGISGLLGMLAHRDEKGRCIAELSYEQVRERFASPFMKQAASFLLDRICAQQGLTQKEIAARVSLVCRGMLTAELNEPLTGA